MTNRCAGQQSLDDLGTALVDVTFCVLDLETTGGSPVDDEICEIGVVKVRGGVCLGTFHTFVDPGRDIPPAITVLTGLTTAMVRPAPPVGRVLPSLLEFLGDSVVVGHNVRFDRSFLDAALIRHERAALANRFVDTCALARRLVRDEVPNCTLGTLADRLRLDHRPSHRALDDALATTDLLHLLLERAAGFGVLALEDLLDLPSAAAHPQARKLAMTTDLPRGPGVYLFRDAGGRVLYVGKASNLRARVRSYFSSDTRRKVGGLLRETASIDHVSSGSALEAAVTEIRLIHQHLPRYNRQGTTWAKAAFVKLTAEPFPRLSVVKAERDDGATYLGPLSSTRVARLVVDAVESALPVRRCRADPLRQPRPSPCAPAQLGVSTCPCAGAIGADEYGTIASAVRDALTTRPEIVLDVLTERMRGLAEAERYEEATDVRDRATAFGDAHRRVRRLELLTSAGTVSLRLGQTRAVIDHGRLVEVGSAATPSLFATATTDGRASRIRPEDVDEAMVLTGWVEKNADRIHLEWTDRPLASPLPRLPDLGTGRAGTRRLR